MRTSLALAGYSVEPCITTGGLNAVNDNIKKSPEESMVLLLGELNGTVKAIKEDVDELKHEMKDSREETSASRRRMYDKLETVDQRLTKMESTVTVMGGVVDKQTKRVDAIEPVVAETSDAVKQMVIRWGLVTASLGAIVSAGYWLVTSQWQTLLKWVMQFIDNAP